MERLNQAALFSDGPTLSVITITFRDASGLQKTAQSLIPLFESSLKWEHVIVDSSPELNEGVISALPLGWPLRYLKSRPEGIYAAMNLGASSARGIWLWFLNGGDYLKDQIVFAAVLSALKETKADLVWASVDLYRNGHFLYPRRPKASLLNNILGTNHLCQQAVFYRAPSFWRIGSFDTSYRLAADYDHFVRCYSAGLIGLRIDGSLVAYDMGGASTNYKSALAELSRVGRTAFRSFPLPIQLCNFVLSVIEHSRVRLVKRIAGSIFAPLLKGAWIWFNRMRN